MVTKHTSVDSTDLIDYDLYKSIFIDGNKPSLIHDNYDFICIQCDTFLRQPILTECGHRMCKSCLEDSLYVISNYHDGPLICPVEDVNCCNNITLESVKPDYSIIDNLKLEMVYCNYKHLGCNKQMQLQELKDHSKTCNFNPKNDVDISNMSFTNIDPRV